MPTVEEINAALGGLGAGVSGAGYNQADPLAGLWEYYKPGGNGGGLAALQAFYNSGRWKTESQYGGLSDASAKAIYENLMARYPTPGGGAGGGSAFNPPVGGDLPGIHRPPEFPDAYGAQGGFSNAAPVSVGDSFALPLPKRGAGMAPRYRLPFSA